MIIFLFGDLSKTSNKEIGYMESRDIYITMIYSNRESPLLQLMSLLFILIDIIYFCILLYLYISTARKLNNYKKSLAIKGLILIIVSSTFFWFFFIMNIFGAVIIPITAVFDVISDNITLFALSCSGQIIYDNICGCLCDNCCGKLFYGANYKNVKETMKIFLQNISGKIIP